MFDYQREKDRAQMLQAAVLSVLSEHVGAENAIKAADLAQAVGERGDRRVRIAISQLRKRGYLILSSVGRTPGYFIASSWEEWKDFRNKNLRPRAMDILETDRAMRAAAMVRFGRQCPLPIDVEVVA
jgi:ribosomal protein L31E